MRAILRLRRLYVEHRIERGTEGTRKIESRHRIVDEFGNLVAIEREQCRKWDKESQLDASQRVSIRRDSCQLSRCCVSGGAPVDRGGGCSSMLWAISKSMIRIPDGEHMTLPG